MKILGKAITDKTKHVVEISDAELGMLKSYERLQAKNINNTAKPVTFSLKDTSFTRIDDQVMKHNKETSQREKAVDIFLKQLDNMRQGMETTDEIMDAYNAKYITKTEFENRMKLIMEKNKC